MYKRQAYDNAHTNLKVTGAVDESKLLELCEKVGKNSVIYGTRLALNKVPGLQAYDPCLLYTSRCV